MVWVVEKQIMHYELDISFERVDIPVRVKFEFEVREGAFVPGTLTKKILYNKNAIEKQYPKIELSSLERGIGEMVENEIMEYLRQCGLLPDKPHDHI